MENYQMSRSGCRPYTRTCGMTRPSNMPGKMCGRSPEQMTGNMCERMPECTTDMMNGRMPEQMAGNCHGSHNRNCSCRIPGTESKNAEMFSHLHHLEPAMAYVPCQEFTTTFDLAYALRVGTIFPQLCKPFCGKRGMGR